MSPVRDLLEYSKKSLHSENTQQTRLTDQRKECTGKIFRNIFMENSIILVKNHRNVTVYTVSSENGRTY